jgi:hypothetical protein
VLVGGVLVVLFNAEPVVVTGPILFVLGLVLMIAAWKIRLLLPAILGLAHCSICLLFTMLVNVRNWSPDEATKPFAIMIGVYLVAVVAPVSAVVFLRMRRMTPGSTPLS